MPELRDWATDEGGAAAELSGGFFIRRVSSPVPAVRPQGRGRIIWVTDNKENVPPSWGVTVRRRSRPRKSPLPEWYPRTPLRDVTAIVRAVERRSRLRAAAAQRRNQHPEVTSSTGHDTTTSPEELSISSETPPIQDNPTIVSDNSSGPTVADSGSSPTKRLQTCCSPDLVPRTDQSLNQSLQSASVPTNAALTDKTAFERKLSSSIDELERIVMENLKKSPKVAPPKKATQRKKTLLSMR